MQLGTRWAVAGAIPTSLPPAVHTAVRAVEEPLAEVDTSAWRWTLTWLERRPVVELDDGTVIRYDPVTDAATVVNADDGA